MANRSLPIVPAIHGLPNFFIIGAAKCGTTSLHHYLGQHPQISMSRLKETNFFLSPDYMEGLQAYRENFDADAPLRGEASPRYSAHPFVEGVPERIHSLTPQAKLIYLVRDPVERAIAHYFERLASNRAPRTLEEAFADLEDPRNLFVCASRYAQQVDRYMEFFPPADLMVVDSLELRKERRRTLRSIFEFLGVEADFWGPAFEQELNTIERKRRPRRVQTWLRHSAFANASRRALPPPVKERLFAATRQVLSAPVERLPGSPELRSRLAGVLRDDTARFRALTGREFDHWSI